MQMRKEEWADMAAAAGKPRGVERLPAGQVGQFLAGYLGPFGLRRSFAVHDVPTGNWVLPGLWDQWGRPGAPYMPPDEMARGQVNRLHFVIRETLRHAVESGTLVQVTAKRGQELDQLLYRCGLYYPTE